MSELPPEPDLTQAMAPVVVGGRYRLDALAGRGGSAEVWKATDTALDRVVALKLVTVAADASAARAGEEARTLARLSHPSLVPVYDAGTDEDGRPWVVMEFVEGETLSDALRRGPLTPEAAAGTGRSVAQALEHVHEQGLVHRDVKPANVLIGAGGRVRLTDFGIARLVDAAKVTSTGLMVGTASYLAPEQVAGERVGPPADVYALGLVLLESLTGRREYAGSTVEVALARLHRQPVVPADLPAGWAPLLHAMTGRDPRARPSAGQVADALAGIGDATVMTAVPASTMLLPVLTDDVLDAAAPRPTVRVPLPPRPVARRARPRRTAVAVAVGVLVLVLGGFLAAQSTGGGATVQPPGKDLPGTLRTDLGQLQQQVGK